MELIDDVREALLKMEPLTDNRGDPLPLSPDIANFIADKLAPVLRRMEPQPQPTGSHNTIPVSQSEIRETVRKVAVYGGPDGPMQRPVKPQPTGKYNCPACFDTGVMHTRVEYGKAAGEMSGMSYIIRDEDGEPCPACGGLSREPQPPGDIAGLLDEMQKLDPELDDYMPKLRTAVAALQGDSKRMELTAKMLKDHGSSIKDGDEFRAFIDAYEKGDVVNTFTTPMSYKDLQALQGDANLGNDLVTILMTICGERGDNEGAVDTLNRVLREREALQARAEAGERDTARLEAMMGGEWQIDMSQEGYAVYNDVGEKITRFYSTPRAAIDAAMKEADDEN